MYSIEKVSDVTNRSPSTRRTFCWQYGLKPEPEVFRDVIVAPEEVYVNGFEEHIRSRGEEVREGRRNPVRRWVVERTFAWLKGFRSLRTRYCCYLVNFMGLLYLAFACILWKKLV